MVEEPLHPLDPRRRQPKPAGKRAEAPGKPTRGKRPRRSEGGSSRHRAILRKKAAAQGPPPGTIRIQKFLAELGYASRRTAEEMVLEGRITVNGKVASRLPIFVDPAQDEVLIDGRPTRHRPEKKVYVLLNKPKGVVSTTSDPEGRPRVIDLVAPVAQRVFPVGRLDAESTGLIILTNDGELANRLTHPRYELTKTYVAEIDGRLAGEDMDAFKHGMYLDGKKTIGAGVKVLHRSGSQTVLEIRLREGKNREIRRIVARLGAKVRSLRRVAIGPITDRGIKTGKYRFLTSTEVQALWRETSKAETETPDE